MASALAGFIVVEGSDGVLVHFEHLGDVGARASLVTVFLMTRIRRADLERSSLPQAALDLDGDA